MVSSLFKWFGLLLVCSTLAFTSPLPVKEHAAVNMLHPFYVSVTEISHNAKEKSLEISCKMFTDDLEKTLKTQLGTVVDLIEPKDKAQAEKIVADYIQKKLQLKVNGQPVTMQYIGYEIESQSLWCYLQVEKISSVKKIEVANSILYEFNNTQFSIIHAVVGGNRKSTRLNFPDRNTSFEF